MNYARIGFKGMIFKAKEYIIEVNISTTPVAYKGGLLLRVLFKNRGGSVTPSDSQRFDLPSTMQMN